MKNVLLRSFCVMSALGSLLLAGCKETEPSAATLLGNPAYPAISYSGWRTTERSAELCPSVEEIKEDMLIMSALGIRFIRTYNTQLFPQTERILQAIAELQAERPDFEMYVMLGAWIQCKGAYTATGGRPDLEDEAQNSREIERAIELTQAYPEIVKVVAVGNEAMVTWQPHHVEPQVIHKWVKHLSEARKAGELPDDLWITTSDNWAALGGEAGYRGEALVSLLSDLDYISLHTYAFHDSYYYPSFEWAKAEEGALPLKEQKKLAVERSLQHQKFQVAAVEEYLAENGLSKAIHIGETGWATLDDSHYGDEGTRVADEYTSMLFHDAVREWTQSAGMSCFYFQAFDEPWKSSTTGGSESHFGLFTNDGEAKAVLWEKVDSGIFEGLGRNAKPITKSFNGDESALMESVLPPRILKFNPGP